MLDVDSPGLKQEPFASAQAGIIGMCPCTLFPDLCLSGRLHINSIEYYFTSAGLTLVCCLAKLGVMHGVTRGSYTVSPNRPVAFLAKTEVGKWDLQVLVIHSENFILFTFIVLIICSY